MAKLGLIRALRTVCRRWWLVVAMVALGAMCAAGTAPAADERLREQAGSATTELVLSPSADSADTAQVLKLVELASRVAAQPEVARAAAEQSPLTDPDLFADAVTVGLDREVGAVWITAHAGDPNAAVEVAAAYASAATRYVGQTTGIELRTIGTPVAADGTSGALPDDPATRSALGALAGLLLGLLLAATVLPGRDGRLHDRRSLERAYSGSVLTEIPRTDGRARYASHVAFLTRPTGTVAEAYRVLRCAVLARGRHGDVLPRVITVTSPGRRDGRSSVTRNLAAALAESGRRVLLLDCDFGHPTAHYAVGIHPGTGLSDLLAAPDPGARLAEIVQPAETPGVVVLSIGTRGGREPGQLASGLPHVIAVARRLVDVVVIDSEPLECAGDALDALEVADAVLIVARSGRTSRATARRTADLLDRLGTRVAGVVLIGNVRETESRTPYLVSRSASGLDEPGPNENALALPAWEQTAPGEPVLA
ncbi:MAG TPA: CpsD/CapB family tyrosine-protein kinase [Sporichthya sp.]|nr:CpsD/CapB family tyrosine-protein kinase [Sporichthya sp.]